MSLRLAAVFVLLASGVTTAAAQEADATLVPFRSDAELREFFAAQAAEQHRAWQAALAAGASACSGGVTIVAYDSTRRGSGDAVITGRVRSSTPDSGGVRAIAGANVYVTSPPASVGTGADGDFDMRIAAHAIPARSADTANAITARIRSVGYRPAAIDFALVQGDSVTLDVALCADATRLSEVSVTGSAAATESITNTQHDGVDEGGIVKRHGDHLVVLRRGKLYTVDVGRGRLRSVAAVNAYGPGIDPKFAWYDELVVVPGRAIVIGYSYAAMATELGVFAIAPDGTLRHESTYHLRSYDYYSSANYATRLIGSRLFLYAPLPFRVDRDDVLAVLPALRRFDPAAARAGDDGFRLITTPQRVFRPSKPDSTDRLTTLHALISCDLAAREIACESTVVLGGWSRVFYLAPRAIYVASSTTQRFDAQREPQGRPAILYRLPLDSAAPTALRMRGLPIDQFSFLEDDTHLNVLLQSHGFGDAMWGAELRRGSLALLRLPLVELGGGASEAPVRAYRTLPAPEGELPIQNRFVGRHLLYGVGNSWWFPTAIRAELFVVPIDHGAVARLPLAHGVDRIEVLGSDALVVGSDSVDLHLARLRLTGDARIVARHVVTGATQGETRSHGFFFRRDERSAERGMLGIPLAREGSPGFAQLFRTSAAVLYLRTERDRFHALGELAARELPATDDDCSVSCVDWYGNTRPLFLDGRVLALLGYEIVEGTVRRGRMVERRRVSFATER